MKEQTLNTPHLIPLNQAIQMTSRYKTMKEAILKEEYSGQDLLSISETFDRAAFDRLLSQPGCTGVRLYYGMDALLNVRSIVVGVNAADQDILPSGTGTTQDEAIIIEEGRICPPECGPSSLLNA